MQILDHFPHVAEGAFRPQFDALEWENDETLFAAWKEGRTGYPIVDAAMRQLNTEAWMHNRGRMVVASFLTKDLLIDWRWGEAYFMQQLVDGDQAANNGGWQWAAGTGTDAQPFFRIFNPTSQGEKFDPDGAYVQAVGPGTCHAFPPASIHQPWTLSHGRAGVSRLRRLSARRSWTTGRSARGRWQCTGRSHEGKAMKRRCGLLLALWAIR